MSERTAAEQLTATAADRTQAERRMPDPARTCPNCGAALADRSCKLQCPTPACGFHLSCSDFY